MLCPKCCRRYADGTTKTGWCGQCDAERHADELADKQRWWKLHGKKTRGHIDLETATLPELETVIQSGMQVFMDVGMCLREVRGRKLHLKAGYTDFETYCLQRWGFGRSYAHRQIEASLYVEALLGSESGDSVLPQGNILTERHVRELMRLTQAEAIEVWGEIVATHPAKLITADLVRIEVDKRLGPPAEGLADPRLARTIRWADTFAEDLEADRLPRDAELIAKLTRIIEAARRYLATEVA